MSLSIGVAPYQQCREDDGSILDDEGWEMVAEDMAAINAALADEGLPAHVEPESVPNLDEVLRVAEAPVSYGDLHLLRVAYARGFWRGNRSNPGRRSTLHTSMRPWMP